MQILNSVKDVQKQFDQKTAERDRDRESRESQLADEGAFPQIAKFVVFGVLILLNVRLFVTAIGGLFGIVVAGAAVMSGAFAIYCWNRIDKSKGKHLRVMQGGAVGFTALELLHATASVWDYMAWLDPDAKAWALWYSHKFAFPIMAGSIITGYAAHRFTWWKAEVNRARAESQITMAVERATLDTQKARLQMEQELAWANLEHLRAMGEIETATQRQIATLTSSHQLPPFAHSAHVNGKAEWDEGTRPKA